MVVTIIKPKIGFIALAFSIFQPIFIANTLKAIHYVVSVQNRTALLPTFIMKLSLAICLVGSLVPIAPFEHALTLIIMVYIQFITIINFSMELTTFLHVNANPTRIICIYFSTIHPIRFLFLFITVIFPPF